MRHRPSSVLNVAKAATFETFETQHFRDERQFAATAAVWKATVAAYRSHYGEVLKGHCCGDLEGGLPPMHTLDRRFLQLWATVTAGAGCAIFLAPILVLLILSIIGIPLAMLLGILPGVWVYLTPTLALYGLLRVSRRRARPLLLLVVAAIPPLAAGFFVPLLANRATEERVGAILAQDHGEPPMLPRGLSIVYAVDRGLGSPDKCWDTCQRLLFSQTAASFAEVSLKHVPLLASLPKPVRRFSLGPIGTGCENSRMQGTYASEKEVGRIHPAPLLWDKLPQLARQGLCLHDDAVRDARPDVLVINRWNYDPAFRGFRFDGSGWRLSLHPIAPFRRREVFRRRTPEGWTRLMRRTEVQYARLTAPLWLVPGFSFDTASPTHWQWRNQRTVGSPIEHYQPTNWNGIIANDLAVQGLR